MPGTHKINTHTRGTDAVGLELRFQSEAVSTSVVKAT